MRTLANTAYPTWHSGGRHIAHADGAACHLVVWTALWLIRVLARLIGMEFLTAARSGAHPSLSTGHDTIKIIQCGDDSVG